jgi:hypothetical protein
MCCGVSKEVLVAARGSQIRCLGADYASLRNSWLCHRGTKFGPSYAKQFEEIRPAHWKIHRQSSGQATSIIALGITTILAG